MRSGRAGKLGGGVGQRLRLVVHGFTLIELLVVTAVIALLLSIAAPRYMSGVDKAKEAVLKEDLAQLRRSIDHHFQDKGKYPSSLEDLVTGRYIRRVPVDPITESATTWVIVAPEDPTKGMVADVHSGAPGRGRDGTPYAEW